MKSMEIEAEKLYRRLKAEAETSGYLLNPDKDFVLDLMEGLLSNQERYGYMACPCRLADGERAKDLDIICPCDYRDPDLVDFGACYCALYVSQAAALGEDKLVQPRDRREPDGPAGKAAAVGAGEAAGEVAREKDRSSSAARQALKDGDYPVWRCKVCGYLCARDEPPHKCPICKADQDRFETFG